MSRNKIQHVTPGRMYPHLKWDIKGTRENENPFEWNQESIRESEQISERN